VWQIVAAALALAACNNRPPLGPPRVDAGRDVGAKDAIVDVATQPEVPPPVACGDDGQPCCDNACNLGLACDRPPAEAVGTCSSRCGHQDERCCRGGGCQSGTACSTHDETGTCQPCGLPGLTCCRADCWIGVCLYENTPRMCVPCGQLGQPCCTYPDLRCDDGARCQRSSPTSERGTCVSGS
jgi:hypothetical protein